MKILYVCNDLAFFRAHRLALARHMARVGHQVAVASGMVAPGDTLDEDVELASLPITKHRFAPINDIRLVFAIRRHVKTSAPDIVHSITMKPNLFAAVALATMWQKRPGLVMTFPGLGKVFEQRGGLWWGLRRRIVTGTFGFVRRRLDPVATVENPADAERLVGEGICASDRVIATLGAGLPLSAFTPATRRGPARVLMAGRLIRAKGIELYIKAVRRLRDDYPDTRFLLAGPLEEDDPDRIDLAAIDVAVREGVIDYRGAVPTNAMPDLLREADIVCLPTLLQEGLPRLLIEAAACGAAAIATDQPSTRQIIEDGQTGWLLQDVTVEGLAKTLNAALSDLAATRRIGAAAANAVRALPIGEEWVFTRFEEAYRQSLTGRS